MTENHGFAPRQGVPVRVADARGLDLDQDFIWSRIRDLDDLDAEVSVSVSDGGVGFHGGGLTTDDISEHG